MAAQDLFALTGHDLDDKYRIERVVAEGGAGVVYRARHLSLGVPVAVKVLKVEDDAPIEPRIRAFSNEAHLVASLVDPAIVKPLDFGVSSFPNGARGPWMVLEWIEGETLRDWIDAHPEGLDAPTCLAWMRPVLRALARAHAVGIVHRDVKPSNLQRAALQDPPLRLLDFGVAKVAHDATPGSGDTRTRSSDAAYTPRYAAPEQVAGARTGPWTDVHALGLVLIELRSGRRAYTQDDELALHREVLAPSRPSLTRCGVRGCRWEPVIARAVALRPADRYPDAGALLDALEAALVASPRRRRWPVAVALAGSLALTAAAVERTPSSRHDPPSTSSPARAITRTTTATAEPPRPAPSEPAQAETPPRAEATPSPTEPRRRARPAPRRTAPSTMPRPAPVE